MVELPGEDVAKDVLAQASKQGGPIAVLAIMLVAAMLLGIGAIGYVLVPVMRDYVTASVQTLESNAVSFTKLSESMSEVHRSHDSMMEAITKTQESVQLNGASILANGQSIQLSTESAKDMLQMMQQAYKMMEDAPQQRQEQTILLRQIHNGIQELSAIVRENTISTETRPAP